MKRPVFAANWKMNHGPVEARTFITTFTTRWKPRDDRTVIFFPPIISVAAAAQALGLRAGLGVGVQNIWTEDKGAFTGETSAPMAKSAGARYVLVGHSERRHIFGENDEQTARKCIAATRHGLIPILCVGEHLAQREAGSTGEVVHRQVSAGIRELSPKEILGMAIAYEPVWAIGTGRTATPEDASEVHARIRVALRAVVGGAAADVPVLYGGSVTGSNAAELLKAEGIDGLLVGGASLDVNDWLGICKT